MLKRYVLKSDQPKSKALLMSTWYRPPSANIEVLDFFNDFLRKADDENKDIVITGDFNCNFLATEYNEHTAKLDNLLTEYQLQQNIKDPTRITPTSKTLLNIIITKMDDTVKQSTQEYYIWESVITVSYTYVEKLAFLKVSQK